MTNHTSTQTNQGNDRPLRIVFAGTPDFAARHLDALLNLNDKSSLNAEVVAVYTQPDRPAGRGKKLSASPVKQLALEHGIEVYQPQNFKEEDAKQALAALNADVMIVVAYGLLLPEDVLAIPRLGCLNVHGSILPRWRGAAPIQRAIWAGDKQTGVTIMQMDKGLDTGDMLAIARLPIEETDTSATLYQKLAELGPKALIDCLQDLIAGKITAQKQQDALANYAQKLSKEEAKINWREDAEHIERCIRAFNPWPMSYFVIKNEKGENENIKVWQARVEAVDQIYEAGEIIRADKTGIYIATATNALVLESIQIPGKKALAVADVLNARSHWFNVGQVLS